ncbi:MAG: YdcF family protein [Oscillospiraceae bacterium]|nr:YdcF family protein [Oscillospiraceae bacterium]
MQYFIVLGNQLNDDSSLSAKGLKRCDITKKAFSIFHPDKIILSGGIANPKAGISEAEALFRHLTADLYMDPDLFILENRSTTTEENALFSLKIAQDDRADEVVVISSIEHFGRLFPKNAVLNFTEVAKKFPSIHLTMYTEDY